MNLKEILFDTYSAMRQVGTTFAEMSSWTALTWHLGV